MRKICSFFMLAALLTSFCFADQQCQIPLSALDKIITNQATCVKGICDDKIYLQEEKIYTTGSGLFLVLNEQGEYIPLPQLLSDFSGCFVKCSVAFSSEWWQCWRCGFENPPWRETCMKCQGPRGDYPPRH